MRSRILSGNGINEIGLKFVKYLGLSFLGIGTIVLFFHLDGYTPVFKQLLKTLHKISGLIFRKSSTNQELNLGSPDDFAGLILLTMYETSWGTISYPHSNSHDVWTGQYSSSAWRISWFNLSPTVNLPGEKLPKIISLYFRQRQNRQQKPASCQIHTRKIYILPSREDWYVQMNVHCKYRSNTWVASWQDINSF